MALKTSIPDTRYPIRILLSLLTTLFWVLPTYSQKADYLAYIEAAAERGWQDHPGVITRWKATIDPSVLWGYNSPSQPIYLADVLGFLYEETGRQTYARRAVQLIAEYGRLREAYPPDYAQTRIEYQNGLPSLSNFFFLPPYIQAYLRIRDSGVINSDTREVIERDLAHSLDFQFHFPEWGAHNRAMLRAEGWLYGSLAMPNHPSASKWKQMARHIAQDNLSQWEIEDATHYQPVWMLSLFSYAEIAGEASLFESPLIRYYAAYLKQLFTPASTIVDIGDANWNPSWPRYVAVLERMAAAYQDPELKWIAQQLFEKNSHRRPGVGAASSLSFAYRWSDESLPAVQPTSASQEVLEDVVGKKIVFRNGWEDASTYLLLNYRDEGDGGLAYRQYLRNTLTVEEEKAHHGQADENDIALLMAGGSVLLHGSGYRSGLPSGPFGAYRADYFHNRLVVRKGKRDITQSLNTFFYDSGAYRPVRTQKIDFLTLKDADMSRTRLIDDKMGYAWDRIIIYLKDPGFFVVIDAIKADVSDYFTYATLWHTRTIHEAGPSYFDTSIDSIGSVAFPQNQRLLIRFLHNTAKTTGHFDEDRHYQPETAIYQTQSSHYQAGDYEVFVTALLPHSAEQPPSNLLNILEVVPTDEKRAGIGLKINGLEKTSYLCVKIDLDSELSRENIRPRYTWDLGRIRYGDIETDAHFLFATATAERFHYSASQFLKVRFRDQTIIEALPNTHSLQPDGSPPKVGYTKWRVWEGEVALRN